MIESHFADKQFFYGKGAGSFPTASAVLSDISALRYDYKYEYKKLKAASDARLSDDFYLRVYVSFDRNECVPQDKFEWIEEYHLEEKRKYITGVIHFSHIISTTWWKENHTSLILLPESVEEAVDIRKLKKKSLELGGVVE